MPRGMSGWLLLPETVPTGRSRSPGGPLSWGRESSQCLAECLVDCFCHGMCRLAAAARRAVPSPSGRGSSQCLAECLVGCFCHGMCRLAAAARRAVPSPSGRGSSQCLAECLVDCFCHGCADLPQPLAGRSPLLGERVRVRAESINPGRIFPATPRRWPGFVHLRHHPSAPDGSASETP